MPNVTETTLRFTGGIHRFHPHEGIETSLLKSY